MDSTAEQALDALVDARSAIRAARDGHRRRDIADQFGIDTLSGRYEYDGNTLYFRDQVINNAELDLRNGLLNDLATPIQELRDYNRNFTATLIYKEQLVEDNHVPFEDATIRTERLQREYNDEIARFDYDGTRALLQTHLEAFHQPDGYDTWDPEMQTVWHERWAVYAEALEPVLGPHMIAPQIMVAGLETEREFEAAPTAREAAEAIPLLVRLENQDGLIRRGDKGEDAQAVALFLSAYHRPEEADAPYYTEEAGLTAAGERALYDFQDASGLRTDGIVGDNTRAAMSQHIVAQQEMLRDTVEQLTIAGLTGLASLTDGETLVSNIQEKVSDFTLHI